MLHFEEEIKNQTILTIANNMAVAARTAPKARGTDLLSIAIADKETLKQLSDKMLFLNQETGHAFLARDAENILHATAILLIGTNIASIGLDCAYCGFQSCHAKNENNEIPCFFNAHDLGVAVGSAVSFAADSRVDSRVMFSVGLAAKQLNLLPKAKQIIGISLSATAKNIFFDRK